MPVTWEIRGSRLRLTLAGDHTADEIERAFTEALGSKLFQPGLTILADVRRATASPSAEEVRDRVALLAPYLSRGAFAKRCAIVTGPDPHRYAVNRSLASVAARIGVDVGVFREIDEALRWLAEKGPA